MGALAPPESASTPPIGAHSLMSLQPNGSIWSMLLQQAGSPAHFSWIPPEARNIATTDADTGLHVAADRSYLACCCRHSYSSDCCCWGSCSTFRARLGHTCFPCRCWHLGMTRDWRPAVVFGDAHANKALCKKG